MRDIMRTYTHTIINCDVADLSTGKIATIDYTLKNHYNHYKHMLTKLSHALEAEHKRLININSYHEEKTSYYMKEETFIKYSDYCTNECDNRETKKQSKKERKKQK